MPGLRQAQWIALAGFLVATLGILLPWASVGDRDAWAFQEGAQYRVGDWLDMGSIDGLLVGVLGVGGLLLTFGQGLGGPTLPRYETGARVAGGALGALALLEAQYVLSLDGVGLGLGLVLVLAGALMAAGAVILPPLMARRAVAP